MKAAYPFILEPNEIIGAEEMGPLYQETIKSDLSMIKFKFFNTLVTGFKTCKFETAK